MVCAVTFFLQAYATDSNLPAIVESLDVAPAWSGHSVGYCLLTAENSQYIAYYDHERRMTVAMLDRLTHRVHIIEANGQSYRLRTAKRRAKGEDKEKP